MGNHKGELSRALKELLGKKMAPLDLDEVETWSGEQFKAWRTGEDKVSQGVVGKALGISQSLISQNEERPLITQSLRARFRKCAESYRAAPNYTLVDPESGLTPEEEFFMAVGEAKRVLNKWLPSIGKGTMNHKFEAFLEESRSIVAEIYRRSSQLSIAAANRRNHATQQ